MLLSTHPPLLSGSSEVEILVQYLENAGYSDLAAKVPRLLPSTAKYLLELIKTGHFDQVLQLMSSATQTVKAVTTPAGAAATTKINLWGRYVADVLSRYGLPELAAKVPESMTAQEAKSVLDALKNSDVLKTTKLLSDTIKTGSGVAPIAAKQTQPLLNLLRSPQFASITGLLQIAYDSYRIAKAASDASDVMDEAQRSGRLTAGAVDKALKSLPSDLQRAVSGIKTTQNMINSYTSLKYNTQQLLNDLTTSNLSPSEIQSRAESYHGIISSADSRIGALSSLLDVMRQTNYSAAAPKQKSDKAANQAEINKAKLELQNAKNAAALSDSKLAMAKASASGQANVDALLQSNAQMHAALQAAVDRFRDLTQSSSGYAQPSPKGPTGGIPTGATSIGTALSPSIPTVGSSVATAFPGVPVSQGPTITSTVYPVDPAGMIDSSGKLFPEYSGKYYQDPSTGSVFAKSMKHRVKRRHKGTHGLGDATEGEKVGLWLLVGLGVACLFSGRART